MNKQAESLRCDVVAYRSFLSSRYRCQIRSGSDGVQ